METTVMVDDPIILPWDAVNSQVTKEKYILKSRAFLEHAGYLSPKEVHHRTGPSFAAEAARKATIEAMGLFIKDAMADHSRTKSQVLGFIAAQKLRIEAGEVKGSTLKGYLKPVRLALEMNEVELPWKKIGRLVPRSSEKADDREYTLEEVRKVVANASLHLKVAVLFMASGGMRVGAFEWLNVGHVQPVKVAGKVVCGKILVYGGEKDDEYETLISLEAYRTFQEYIGFRRNAGGDVSQGSPAVVTKSLDRRCTPNTVRTSLNDLLWKIGIRTEHKRRHEFQVDHGLRKFYDNALNDHVEKVYVEMMMGHTPSTLGVRLESMEHYDRHLPKRAVEQYLKAMPYVSIDESYRQEAQLSQELEDTKKTHGQDYNALREQVNELRLQLVERNQKLDEERRKREETEKMTVEMVGEGRKLLEELRAEKAKRGPSS